MLYYIFSTFALYKPTTLWEHERCIANAKSFQREKALRKIHARASARVHSPASFVALRIGAMYHFRSNNS